MADVRFSEKDLQTFYSYTEELEHHGILGQKWGRKMGPPYPLDSGDHSAAEKKAGWRDSLKATASKVKSAADETADKVKSTAKATVERFTKKQQPEPPKAEVKKEPERVETPEEKKAREADERRRIVESGDAALVKENATKLSYQELNEAVNRVNLMQRLDQMTPVEPPTQNKIDHALQVIDENATRVKKGIDTYNKIADIYNRFSEPPLPKIDKSLEERRKDAEKEVKKKARDAVMNELKKHPDRWMDYANQLSDEELQTLSNRAGNLNKMKTQLGLFNGTVAPQQGKGNKGQQNQNQNNQTNQNNQQNQNKPKNEPKTEQTGDPIDDRVLRQTQKEVYQKGMDTFNHKQYAKRLEAYADETLGEDWNMRGLDDIERYGFRHSDVDEALSYYGAILMEAIRA